MRRNVETTIRTSDGLGVGVKLRSVALSLPVKKGLDVAARVFAQLVIRNPLGSLRILDIAIDAEAALAIAQAVLIARHRMRPEQPAPPLVGDGVLERGGDEVRSTVELGGGDAAALEVAGEVGAKRLHALGVPAFELVLGDALQPGVGDDARVAYDFLGPREFYFHFFSPLFRRGPLHRLGRVGKFEVDQRERKLTSRQGSPGVMIASASGACAKEFPVARRNIDRSAD